MNLIKKAYILAVMLLLFCLSGCAKQGSSEKIYDTKADFTGCDAGSITGTVMNTHVDNVIDGITWHYYDDQAGALEALKKGDIAAAVMELPIAEVITRIFYMDEGVIYEEGTPEQVFLHPKKDKTRAFVKRLKVLSLSVKSADFDFIAMSETLQNFGQKHMLTQKRTTNMRRIFEEILALNLIPNGSPTFPLELTAEYAEETDTLQMRLRWAGPEYDPLAQGDELPLKLGRTAVTDSQFTYEDGENLLVLTL